MSHNFFFAGCINPPHRSSSAATVIVLLVVTISSLTMVMPETLGNLSIALLALLFLLAIAINAVYASHVTFLALAWFSLVNYIKFLHTWPFSMLIPIFVYGVVVMSVPWLRRSVGWIRIGRFTIEIWWLTLLIVIISSLALVFWYMFTSPDIGHHLELFPALPIWTFPLIAIGFSFLNAALEESIFRGVMMEALDSALGEGYWSISVQAVSFAALHYLQGFPSGVLGFIMTFAYGFMLGIVRRRSRGMLAPWITHAATDLTIFTILAVTLI
jgi:membrane protease YdiL (CAAX protease family)